MTADLVSYPAPGTESPGAGAPDPGALLTLALDTSGATAVGLARGGRLLASRTSPDPRAHVEQTVPLVHAVLAEVGLRLADLQRLVVGVGPGPFTGLRVGLATAEVLALALGRPLVGVCSLDGLAAQVVRRSEVAEDFVVVTDARRREVYWARYDAAGTRLSGPEVGPAEELPTVALAGPLAEELAALDPSRRVLAGAAALDAGVMAAALDRLPAVGLEPLYLRRPDAVEPGPAKSTLVAPPLRRRPRSGGAP